jgi:hypothetical protein
MKNYWYYPRGRSCRFPSGFRGCRLSSKQATDFLIWRKAKPTADKDAQTALQSGSKRLTLTLELGTGHTERR